MSEIHFTEEQLKDPQALAAALFAEDESDPRSWNYKRQLVRPKIHWVRILLFFLLFALGISGIFAALTALAVPSGLAATVCSVAAIAVLLLFLKKILICLIQIYQRYAPAVIRNKCRFEPSCSQYMILALRKYGLRKGFCMGIDRIKRCNTNHGGFDYP